MKWTLFELEKLNQIDETIDEFEVPDGYDDLLSITNIKVTGTINHLPQEVEFLLNIKADLLMSCAYSLKDVLVPVDFDLDLLFGNTNESDYELTNPLELADIILGNILVEKPFRVIHPDAKDQTFDLEKEVHPAFEELADLLKK
ncbi:MAG: YceD family protein [Acholeplasmataceae bacterium]|jgi:uncharacterized metal-binding protein YceD (DUF177 family)